jgi:hypothetical protein
MANDRLQVIDFMVDAVGLESTTQRISYNMQGGG